MRERIAHLTRGRGVDYLLAGTAAAVGAELLTTNVRDFPMFEGLVPPYE